MSAEGAVDNQFPSYDAVEGRAQVERNWQALEKMIEDGNPAAIRVGKMLAGMDPDA